MSFQLDVGQHTDIVLGLRLTLSDSRTEPWGLLRLPVYEVVSRGSHQGWFFLLDRQGNPFRKRRCHHSDPISFCLDILATFW